MTYTLRLEIPEEQYRLLAQTAEQTKQSIEEVAVQWLAKTSRAIADDPIEKYIGAFVTNVPDWGEHHDELLGEALLDDHRDLE